MTFGELQHAVDIFISRGVDACSPVLVTTADPVMGGRGSVEVQFITSGMDWERGQIRIEPAEKLLTMSQVEQKNFTVPQRAGKIGTKTYVCYCEKCTTRFQRAYTYCPCCGRKILWENSKSV